MLRKPPCRRRAVGKEQTTSVGGALAWTQYTRESHARAIYRVCFVILSLLRPKKQEGDRAPERHGVRGSGFECCLCRRAIGRCRPGVEFEDENRLSEISDEIRARVLKKIQRNGPAADEVRLSVELEERPVPVLGAAAACERGVGELFGVDERTDVRERTERARADRVEAPPTQVVPIFFSFPPVSLTRVVCISLSLHRP